MAKWRLSPRIGIILNLGLGLVFALAAVLVVVLVNQNMHQQALVEAEAKSRVLIDRNLATHIYFTQILKPRLFEWTVPFRPADYFEPSWMSSTYAVREIDQYFRALSPAGYYVKDAAINARSPENEADAYERAFLDELNANPTLEARSTVRTIDGQPYLTVLRRGEMLEAACLRCHGDPADAPGDLVRIYGPDRSFGRQVGEVISAISIRVPLAAAYASADQVSWQLSTLLLLLLGALFVVQFGLYRWLLLMPLATIRNKALQIATDERHLGEEIPRFFGRELRELAQAFNALSINLRRDRDQLEEHVRERTADLQSANEQLTHEVAERQRVEEDLRRERDFAEGLVAMAQVIVLVLDLDGHIVHINPYLEDISGYCLADVQGWDWFATFLPARDQARIRELFLQAVDDVQTQGNVNVIVTQDGREREIEWYDKTLKDASGRVIGLLSVGRDITERQQMEAQIHRHAQELEERVARRTAELRTIVDSLAGREIRMAELKKAIRQLRAQLEDAGLTPVADDPLAPWMAPEEGEP
ncbi:MAG: DUF3365 domain-containing protein [Chloroflexi bacterium]|nr:DUF3365 domain-containing protein [Chloroflexota bacterium]